MELGRINDCVVVLPIRHGCCGLWDNYHLVATLVLELCRVLTPASTPVLFGSFSGSTIHFPSLPLHIVYQQSEHIFITEVSFRKCVAQLRLAVVYSIIWSISMLPIDELRICLSLFAASSPLTIETEIWRFFNATRTNLDSARMQSESPKTAMGLSLTTMPKTVKPLPSRLWTFLRSCNENQRALTQRTGPLAKMPFDAFSSCWPQIFYIGGLNMDKSCRRYWKGVYSRLVAYITGP